MKKVLILVWMLSGLLIANELKTVYSYQNAIYKAKKENKTVLVMMSYAGCPVCDYMKDIVLERPNILEYLNSHYYVVIKDLQRDHYPERFSVIDSPTFFFIDPKTEEEVIPKQSGGFRPDAFLALLKRAAGDVDIAHDSNATLTHAAETNSTIKPCNKTATCEEEKKITIH